jgi:hypothetical protein
VRGVEDYSTTYMGHLGRSGDETGNLAMEKGRRVGRSL